jgi:hypothetical protein
MLRCKWDKTDIAAILDALRLRFKDLMRARVTQTHVVTCC